MKSITVATIEGEEKVKAYKTKCPSLFVHRSLENGKTWVITHAPSGYSVLKAIDTLKQARLACEEMAKIEGWGDLKPENASKFHEDHYDILARSKDIAYMGNSAVGH